ncbi:MAG: methyltransferase [Acidobacteriota bacterium]|nr:methyltransferase [Acidobacteriota bacterium]
MQLSRTAESKASGTGDAAAIQQKFLATKASLEKRLGEPLSISGLTGPLRIFQRQRGHRHSIDDALTAWYALQKCPGATRYLDLGSGVGTVGMIVLWGLADQATLTCIEAYEKSYALLQTNLECNGLLPRATAIHGDLREFTAESKFHLVTGSPPYFPCHAGPLPADPQKAWARFELRGHVGDYARTAVRCLRDDGLFIYCFPHRQKQRGLDLVTREGLHIDSYRDVVPTPSKQPLFSVYCASLHGAGPLVEEPALIVHEPDGRYSPEMLQIQATRGFGPMGTNVIRSIL